MQVMVHDIEPVLLGSLGRTSCISALGVDGRVCIRAPRWKPDARAGAFLSTPVRTQRLRTCSRAAADLPNPRCVLIPCAISYVRSEIILTGEDGPGIADLDHLTSDFRNRLAIDLCPAVSVSRCHSLYGQDQGWPRIFAGGRRTGRECVDAVYPAFTLWIAASFPVFRRSQVCCRYGLQTPRRAIRRSLRRAHVWPGSLEL